MTSFYTICTEYSKQTMARWCLREEWECPFSELSAGVSVLGMTRKRNEKWDKGKKKKKKKCEGREEKRKKKKLIREKQNAGSGRKWDRKSEGR